MYTSRIILVTEIGCGRGTCPQMVNPRAFLPQIRPWTHVGSRAVVPNLRAPAHTSQQTHGHTVLLETFQTESRGLAEGLLRSLLMAPQA